jgi:hypothetical protein
VLVLWAGNLFLHIYGWASQAGYSSFQVLQQYWGLLSLQAVWDLPAPWEMAG